MSKYKKYVQQSYYILSYRYLKAAKEVQQKNEKLTDEQCNALLQNALELNTEIWLPEK